MFIARVNNKHGAPTERTGVWTFEVRKSLLLFTYVPNRGISSEQLL